MKISNPFNELTESWTSSSTWDVLILSTEVAHIEKKLTFGEDPAWLRFLIRSTTKSMTTGLHRFAGFYAKSTFSLVDCGRSTPIISYHNIRLVCTSLSVFWSDSMFVEQKSSTAHFSSSIFIICSVCVICSYTQTLHFTTSQKLELEPYRVAIKIEPLSN